MTQTAPTTTLPPLTTRFELGPELTPVQQAFLGHHGYLVFKSVATPEEVATIKAEAERLSNEWLASGRRSVFGIPLFKGYDADGKRFVQRLAFASCFSEPIHDFVRDPRLKPVRQLIGDNTRVGDREKDGVVINRNLNVPGSIYKRLGWHTDGLRDLFYLRMPKQQINVGLHLDRITEADGGLRLIPGSHNQGFMAMAFLKPYFVWHKPDPREICVETEPGDLTVHDGRLWHRVQQSSKTGPETLRHSMYVPYLTDDYQPKDENSKTPPYHRLGMAMRAVTSTASRMSSRLTAGRARASGA